MPALAADIVITTGGTGFSDRDFVRSAVAELGGKEIISSIAMRPGHPSMLAALPDGRILVALPGNPLAALMAVATLVDPLLRGACGTELAEPGSALGTADFAPLPGRHRLIPARWVRSGDPLVPDALAPAEHVGSAMLRGLSGAEAILVIPPAGARAGTPVGYLRTTLVTGEPHRFGRRQPEARKRNVRMGRKIVRRRIVRATLDGARSEREEKLAVEEPLEIRFGSTPFTTSMRTPGDDFDMVAGFLLAEGIISRAEHLVAMRYCAGTDEEGNQTFNVIEVQLGFGAQAPDLSAARNVVTSSACGICGTNSIDEVRKKSSYSLDPETGSVELETLLGMPDTLREAQELFSATGGVHAAGLFSTDGELLVLREDVGRHNAVDKVIGCGPARGHASAGRDRPAGLRAGRPSSWSRRPRWRGSRCSPRSARRRRWPLSWRNNRDSPSRRFPAPAA